MDWELLPVALLYADVRAYCSHVNRDLTIRQRRRQWKCSWKLDFVSFETFAPLYQVTQLLESKKLRLEMKRRNRVRVQREREGESKIYRLAVSVLKSTQNLVISPRSCAGTAKKCTKKCHARAELLFNLLIRPIVFRRSRCCHRRSFVRSLIDIVKARLLSSHPWLLLPS